jgi:hypothetical protein
LLGGGASANVAVEALPFGPGDTTAGSETELQAAVIGRREDVDLPLAIERSNYFSNLLKRAAAGETPKRALRDLRRFLDDDSQVWEQSWVRFPLRALNGLARQVLADDLRADKGNSETTRRSDADRFFITDDDPLLRVPVSYMLKLALANVLGKQTDDSPEAMLCGTRLLRHFLNDNVSPETVSFYISTADDAQSVGSALASETSLRFLLTQLLTEYANERFGLRARGQEATVYFSPHPPTRQKQLNECIADSYYRELFISPCLSGWDRGHEKQEYMSLCHQVLSRSQLRATAKVVHDAGLIAGRCVLLPSLSTISLNNNGIHVSLGSRKLGELLSDQASGVSAKEEKYFGDLAIKIIEHFLPLFVGTYSAAPFRLGFADFHAERVLGFLPHQLDFTHLRMLWRRWKKKASIKLFGQPISPSGNEWFDRMVSTVLRLEGDFVPDYRLMDYLVAPLSTAESAALDGSLGNAERLKRDLAEEGVYDSRMSLYMLCRQRAYADMGFSGFEGRYYSLCESLHDDLAPAVDLQNLVTALAFQYIADGTVAHADIPDNPSIESERRQIFFGAAAGIPTFFVRTATTNTFLRRILELCERTRFSHRYPGYVRVYHLEYRRALLRLLRRDAAALIEAFGAAPLLDDLQRRVEQPHEHSVAGKLTRGILDDLNVRSPLKVPADEFNLAAESFYRNTLRHRQTREALAHWESLVPQWLPQESREEASEMARCMSRDGNPLAAYKSPQQLERLITLLLRTLSHKVLEDRHAHVACNHATVTDAVCAPVH